MAVNERKGTEEAEGGDLRARAFSWYWNRLARRIRDPEAFSRLIHARRAELDDIARRTEERIAEGRIVPPDPGSDVWLHLPHCFRQPISPAAHADPASGTALGPLLAMFHDDEGGVFALTQRPNRSPNPATRFELFFESYEFEGTYLSFALRVPDKLRRPQQREQLVLSVDALATRRIKSFARLNIETETAKETLYAEAEIGSGPAVFGFDLSFTTIEARENDLVWVDLIIDRPRMVEITIRSLFISLRNRDHG